MKSDDPQKGAQQWFVSDQDPKNLNISLYKNVNNAAIVRQPNIKLQLGCSVHVFVYLINANAWASNLIRVGCICVREASLTEIMPFFEATRKMSEKSKLVV